MAGTAHAGPSEHFTRWPFWRRWFGARSETAAAQYLRRNGHRILARNVADARGEMDILALDGDTLVVVEVRSTASTDLERVVNSVDFAKQRQLSDAIARYLKRRGMLGQVTVRFDVLGLSWPPGFKRPVVRHIKDAFQSVGRFQMFQ